MLKKKKKWLGAVCPGSRAHGACVVWFIVRISQARGEERRGGRSHGEAKVLRWRVVGK